MATSVTSTTAQEIIDQSSILLQDTTKVRWSDVELLMWVNAGQNEIVIHRPEAGATVVSQAVATANSKQSIPAGGLSLIEVVRNMGAAGATPGRAIRLVSQEIMDTQTPTWHTATGAEVLHYTFDPRNPTNFYVYPVVASWQIEIVYSKPPANLSTVNPITVPEVYASALVNYVMYRAYSKDAEYAANPQLAGAYYKAFADAIGLTINNSIERNPNQLEGGFNPNVPKRSNFSGGFNPNRSSSKE